MLGRFSKKKKSNQSKNRLEKVLLFVIVLENQMHKIRTAETYITDEKFEGWKSRPSKNSKNRHIGSKGLFRSNRTDLGGTVPIWVLTYLRTDNAWNSTALNIFYDLHTGLTNLKKDRNKKDFRLSLWQSPSKNPSAMTENRTSPWLRHACWC